MYRDQQIAATGQQVATASSNAHDALTSDRAALLSRLQQAGLTQAQLATGATDLDDGIGKLVTGATSLHSRLADGMKQIPNPSAE